MPEFKFDEPGNLGVLVCENVLKHNCPVLYVSHDEDGDWQFLCGGQHDDDSDDGAALICLNDIVRRDPTLNEVAAMCTSYEAERDKVGSEWRIHDRMEDIVHQNVLEHGCHVMGVLADDQAPAFAYSIGLTKSYGQPELICFGLAADTMHWMINELRTRMADGSDFKHGDWVLELIEGYDCALRTMAKKRYREYLGYARWFHGGDDFDTLQVVWPDKERRFPWDTGCTIPQSVQPRVWE